MRFWTSEHHKVPLASAVVLSAWRLQLATATATEVIYKQTQAAFGIFFSILNQQQPRTLNVKLKVDDGDCKHRSAVLGLYNKLGFCGLCGG